MARPDYAFRTSTHTIYLTATPGGYRAEPGDRLLSFSLERQRVPPELPKEEMARAAMAWVMASQSSTSGEQGALPWTHSSWPI
ncbi:MAG: hypothetical protein O7A67_02415 [SAR324 cluster bacterium]|nr:hypothetical protein [SAR324 cluster bacterium]